MVAINVRLGQGLSSMTWPYLRSLIHLDKEKTIPWCLVNSVGYCPNSLEVVPLLGHCGALHSHYPKLDTVRPCKPTYL